MIRIRLMTAADIALGMRLKEQAGWNQTEADWQRCLDLEPSGCFVADYDGLSVGTTTTCIFGQVAWIAMVLVDSSMRGRGIGKALMEHALTFLDSAGVPSIRLDATPLGQPLYEKLGFARQFSLTRWEGTPPVGSAGNGVEQAPKERWGQIVDLDAAATGTNRRKQLERLFAERPDSVRIATRARAVRGYAAARYGSRAVQIGPCLAEPWAGPLLLGDACRHHAGKRVYLDVPVGNNAATACARGLGLTAQRQLTRMVRGPEVRENLDLLWASSGPEKG
jgi:GNAT superfamily N-acetyltransferase